MKLKPQFKATGKGICDNCGRNVAEDCHCGEEVKNVACSLHPKIAMRVTVIQTYRYRSATGLKELDKVTDVAECSVSGCGNIRALKYAQGIPRNQNRKTERRRK